jgi:YggT family protein
MDIVLSRVMFAVADLLDGLLSLYFWILIIAVVLSWVNADPHNPIVRFLHAVTDPVLYQVRHRLPFVVFSGIDFSPWIVVAVIKILQTVVVGSLRDLAMVIRTSLAAGGHVG